MIGSLVTDKRCPSCTVRFTRFIRPKARLIINNDDELDYDDAIIEAVALEGEEFKINTRTVHQIILRNVHEDSDAYTYIKPLLRSRDGRKDMLALRQRYQNDATKQTIINAAKSTLSNLRYKNE